MSAESERAAIRKQWPAEFNDGVRCGFLQKCPSRPLST
jgi:hypothetical protein